MTQKTQNFADTFSSVHFKSNTYDSETRSEPYIIILYLLSLTKLKFHNLEICLVIVISSVGQYRYSTDIHVLLSTLLLPCYAFTSRYLYKLFLVQNAQFQPQ